MKLFIVGLGLFVLSACATSSSVENLEQRLTEERSSVQELDTKIEQLELDRQALNQKLITIDSNGQSISAEAKVIKNRIHVIDESIVSYKKAIITINKSMSKVTNQQSVQHGAAKKAVEENQALKEQADEEIRLLEIKYAKMRKKALEEDNLEDPDGE